MDNSSLLQEAERKQHNEEQQLAIEVCHVFKQYPGSFSKSNQVFKDLSWRAKKGQITGLIGPNGSGKTTMFQMLIGNIGVDDGQIKVFGEEIGSIGQGSKDCALLPEHPLLPKDMSGRMVLKEFGLFRGLSPRVIAQRIDEAASLFPLAPYFDRPCVGYSRGQAVMISLARVHILDHPILLLDEPTAGLDFENAKVVRDWARSQKAQGKTIVISSHLLGDIKDFADHIVGLSEGRSASDEKLKSWFEEWKNVN